MNRCNGLTSYVSVKHVLGNDVMTLLTYRLSETVRYFIASHVVRHVTYCVELNDKEGDDQG